MLPYLFLFIFNDFDFDFDFRFRCECYDYLFGIAVEMRRFGLDPNAAPNENS